MAADKELVNETGAALLESIKQEVARLDGLRAKLVPMGDDVTDQSAVLLRLAQAYGLVAEHQNRAVFGHNAANGYRQV